MGGIFYLFFLLLFAEQDSVLVAALAKVEGQVITTRDLQIFLFVNEVDNPLSLYIEKKEPLKEIVAQYLIVRESASLMSTQVPQTELAKEEGKVLRRLSNDKLWLALGVQGKELREHIQRKLLVRQLIGLKMPLDMVTVSEASVESYYMQNRNQLGQKPIDEVRASIEKSLKLQKNQERFKDWMSSVLRTSQVYYYSGYKIQ